MTTYTCANCAKVFNQKSHYEQHLKLKNVCEKEPDKLQEIINNAVSK